MSNSEFIFDATLENFQQKVLEASMSTTVVIDVWAEWCQPCKQLSPILEKLAEEYRGAFVLAKVNAEEQQELAGHLGVQSLPNVKIVKQGQLLDEFNSALPEGEIREKLDQHVDAPPESDQEKAKRLWSEGQLEEAEAVLVRMNQQNPQDYDVLIDLARLRLEQGQLEEARAIYESLPGEERLKPGAKQVEARFEFEEQARDIPPVAELQARVKEDPSDVAAMNQLATHGILAGDYEAAMELLLKSVQTEKDFEDGAAKSTLIKLFDLLGNENSLVRQYRRRLFAMMY
ncbi:co-chaperone YbbN [Salicola sp. Rm-C-2C1-2]|uniref:co-chaperone YbbN n=1 Tax=Salicola sp. Rm-C-2C1-2 TaxID=3141321 RepID=UPI0032E4D108